MRRLLLAIGLSGCTASAVPESPPVTNTTVEAPAADRCRSLPLRVEEPGADCVDSGPLNSDGSRKRLAAPRGGEPGRWVLFEYDDFGPQVMAFQLLGMGWWSWSGGGSWEMCDEFDVRVVVYEPADADEVARLYPTVENESDYRLVSRPDALTFLDTQIADLASDDSEIMQSLRASLQRTRATIAECLR
jgi:hypothetical protein